LTIDGSRGELRLEPSAEREFDSRRDQAGRRRILGSHEGGEQACGGDQQKVGLMGHEEEDGEAANEPA
ncbi:MAG TPA: hypothetical protein VK922_04225, partial [Gemmatimonadaceae bacterium]|nr:hypothetical protein [Gemmatimonadaceae bacterium]